MLPSSLFYGSTLQCCVSDAMAHPNAPFPLVFVCSSIDQTTAANSKDNDEREAAVLVEEVNKYCKTSWPTLVWGEVADPPGKVCIMTPSSTQVCTTIQGLRSYSSLVSNNPIIMNNT